MPNGSGSMQSRDNKVYSVIDIGTNTCLLLIATIRENKLIKLFEAQEIPRLGKDLYKTGIISEEAFQKTLSIFNKYISHSKDFNSEKIFAFGTSALRDANNSAEFIEFIGSECGVKIKVLTGEDEAKYSYNGSVYDLEISKDYAVIDIGGGSTEIGYRDGGIIISDSIDIGSVRIYEEFLKGNINHRNIETAGKFIESKISSLECITGGRSFVGVAGTITTLSALKNRLKEFDEVVIHKDILTLPEIGKIFENLISMTEEERINLAGYMKGRSDIIISGILILTKLMEQMDIQEITVSTKGLRYGLFLNIPDFI